MTLLLARAGVDFCANTVGDAESQDVRLGRRVARIAGWDWRRSIYRKLGSMVTNNVALALALADGRLPVLKLSGVPVYTSSRDPYPRPCIGRRR